MSRRVLLYGVLVAVVVAGSTGDNAGDADSPVQLTVRQQAGYKNVCLREIIGFEQSATRKFSFCECVLEKYQEKLKANEALIEGLNAFYVHYVELRESPRKTSRALASRPQENFKSSSEKLDLLFSSKDLRYPFKELIEEVKPLGEHVESAWKTSFIECTHPSTPAASQTN
jgi:hypothetical protein